MVKLNKPVEMLEVIREKIEAKIAQLEERKEAIEGNAWDKGRDMTEREREKVWAIEAQIEKLQAEAVDIGNALSYLRGYTE